MKTIARNPKNVVNDLFPVFGQRRTSQLPIWCESQKMFIANEYVSAAGHRYYQGVHIGEQIVIVENIGDYYNFTYLDGIAIFGYDGNQLKLLQKKDYQKTFYSEALVRAECSLMLEQTITAQYKMKGMTPHPNDIQKTAREFVDVCYNSILQIVGPVHMERIIPILDQVKPKERD